MSAKSKLNQESNSLETPPGLPGNILEVLQRLEGRIATLENKFVHLDTDNTVKQGLDSGNGSESRSNPATSLEDLRQDLNGTVAKLKDLREQTDLAQEGLQKVTKSIYVDFERVAWSNFFDFRWGKRSSSYDFEYEMRKESRDFRYEMRTDFIDFRYEMRRESRDFRYEMRTDFIDFKSEMRTDLNDGKVEMRKESIDLRYEMEKELIHLRYDTKAYVRKEVRCINKSLSERISRLESKE